MWFENISTGVKWEIVDKELIKRLSNDDNYEEVKEKVEKKKETKKTTTKKKSK